jgi:hypothetical protein
MLEFSRFTQIPMYSLAPIESWPSAKVSGFDDWVSHPLLQWACGVGQQIIASFREISAF